MTETWNELRWWERGWPRSIRRSIATAWGFLALAVVLVVAYYAFLSGGSHEGGCSPAAQQVGCEPEAAP